VAEGHHEAECAYFEVICVFMYLPAISVSSKLSVSISMCCSNVVKRIIDVGKDVPYPSVFLIESGGNSHQFR
jgi:hypothetical protein